jgi:hypothetical protein
MSRFDLPNRCSKCLADQPTEFWRLSTSEYKEGHGNSTVCVTYYTHVPVCKSCHRGLTGLSWLCWLVALSIGAVAVSLIVIYAPKFNQHLDTFPPAIMFGGLAIVGGLIVWGSGWLLNTLFVDASLGAYMPHEQTIAFTNRDYQQLFDQANAHLVEDRSWMHG